MACFAVFAFSACSLNKSGAPDSKGKEPLKIICTNFASYDFVRQIVGDKAEVTMLLKPGAEAHSYEPSPMATVLVESALAPLPTATDLIPVACAL